jgi:hypothetical protein
MMHSLRCLPMNNEIPLCLSESGAAVTVWTSAQSARTGCMETSVVVVKTCLFIVVLFAQSCMHDGLKAVIRQASDECIGCDKDTSFTEIRATC